MKRLVLVDGNALLHRAYHATPPLSTSSGELVNAVFGFTSMLLKVLDELTPDYLCIAWDLKARTFRHEAYEGYKATRKVADEALTSQYDRVFELQKAFNIPDFKLPGFEADDLIGALARQAEKKEKALEIIIVTGDRDIMQLIDKKIKVLMPKKTLIDVGLYGEEEFALRFGFSPKSLPDYKGLAGDPSDNIPGVTGVGEVTATKLIHQYQTLEKLYTHLKELPEKTKTLLEKGKEIAFLSKKLATIETEIPIKLDLLSCRVHDFDRSKVVKLLEELEFRSLIPRIPGWKWEVGSGKLDLEVRNFDQKIKKSTIQGQENLTSNIKNSIVELDHQLEPVLKKMSETGVAVDLKFLSKLSKDLHKELVGLEKEIYALVGHEFNLNSPKQLSVVLFDELNLKVVRKTKTGRSTDEQTLTELSAAHPVVVKLLRYRQLFKLISTYVDALPRYTGKDGRVHSTFNVEGASTGRLSSQDPNLQNIPVGGQLGGEVRRAFVAQKGKVLLSADYSQIELRILAHLADDPNLKQAFGQNLDIHTLTAAKIFQVSVEKVTHEQRMVGKTMNFATLYGQGPRALSRQLGIDYHIARDYIDEYFAQFPKVKIWMNKILEEAREKGYVETLWGRKRYFPELKIGDKRLQAFGERAAINHPVQGTAADMIKKAMVEISSVIASPKGARQSPCQMILQVHDELLFECSPKEIESTAKMVKDKMEHALELSVPVIVDIKIGPNWGEMQNLV
ncbi:hypothetical protein HY385_02130 [Candidatus Daviesbacteria bacterium]|nr:hypothetical protein [Candidatus Daviesbacteria bacterium]